MLLIFLPSLNLIKREATLSINYFLSSTSSRREALKRKIFGESEKAPRDILMAVVEKTAAEVSAGTMVPRRAMEDLIDIHGLWHKARLGLFREHKVPLY